MEATHVGAEPQATSATDPAPVAPGGVPLGGEPLAPPAEAPPPEQSSVDGDNTADHQAGGDPEDWSPATRKWMGSPEETGQPVRSDPTHPAPAVMMTEDGLRQHGEITPGLGNAPTGDATDLPEERPNTTGLVEPEQIETERPDIGTPGV